MELLLSKNAQKHLNHLPKSELAKVRKKLLMLTENPGAGKKLSGELEGCRALRVWPYRIIYKINVGARSIEVSDILHRQGAYK